MILVTGGAGFIGSNFILNWIGNHDGTVINLDKLTYAGNLHNLDVIRDDAPHIFVHGDIADREAVAKVFSKYRPKAVINFAAESHVDRSIHSPGEFMRTNVDGVFNMLEVARAYWSSLDKENKKHFRFLHVSTDEVYGSLGANDPAFSETTSFSPNSPYAASKAASDHLVRAWHKTYGLPTLTTNCSNNYGPYQFPEKLIPLIIRNALAGKPLPIYGDGLNIRDWLYVEDHCSAICQVLAQGRVGETYNIGGRCEMTNLDVVNTICRALDDMAPSDEGPYSRLITFVEDRPGHDRRYAIDASKIESELGWTPRENFTTGIKKTVRWYLDNQPWVENIESGDYRNWLEKNYQDRSVI